MQASIDRLTEAQRVAFYGALFAMAAKDGTIDREEVEIIYGTLDVDHLSEPARRQVHGYIIEPPQLRSCLAEFAGADDTLRCGLMVSLVDVAWADDVVEPAEREALQNAQSVLHITDQQLAAIEKFTREMKAVRERGVDDEVAKDTVKRAGAGLAAVGVPITAVYFSGTVVGLSAAGITSGLAALGLGLGMVPGIGVAILLGTTLYFTASWLLDTGSKRKRESADAERTRRTQLVLKNLQSSIMGLLERLRDLQGKAADAVANREAIERLSDRLRTLKQVLARRERLATVP